MNRLRTPRAAPFLAAAANFASGRDTSRAFLERCLETLGLWEEHIHAFVHLDVEAARASADRSTVRWRSGRPLSAIDGMPLGIKDIIETADMPTGQGSPLFSGWQTHRDAASVAALRAAGAIIVGKTVSTEFAATEPGETRNPWDLSRTPGGSSSGSAAAVTAGLISAALGTQGIASIVRPASFCGCFGFKPSLGAINRGGSYDTISQSCTGVLGGTLEDTWQVARETAIRAGGDPGFLGLVGPERAPTAAKPHALMLLETAGYNGASPGARNELGRVADFIKHKGIAILDRHSHRKVATLEDALTDARTVANSLNAWEMRWPLNTYSERDAAKLSAAIRERLTKAEAMTLEDYHAALSERERLRQLYADLRTECDGCVALAASGPAPVGLRSTGDPTLAVPFTMFGAPVISVPVLHDQALPLGLQVAGFRGDDAATFAIAAWLVKEITSHAADSDR
jgi:Asp-tRNA(Asn)/Glu-tRNA(Gln) amidotransferase A subunit family amidase